ncbi:thiamine pyrophosphate-dependent dehydrogenase E1 component subunit alpha [Coxiella burnetii]|uniref:Pyruvate dehydrogenase E1 component alpha subunit n=2 Tax=Coxiella burnetii TaxID=777 RepID=B5U8Q8_COXBU|nr:thiamine pyrophosphate-dependent dehydrogenase E1 component subunit alpha [Coxiella burnetii]NP_819723.2 pyruvate dehydrogenase E1 component subunit alpha [Coxiella burnetii RSA 493]AAO90237.2 pyruvate dehydrogenase E1 component alpha subunit [Coxiella burnetii RSA 493]OYK84681.1 acetoin dehydrogenase [Coxiella burnetii]OYK88498.1 acetoin dehydrogenase [Coxiella burnetii]OYK91980.1 acetoin dehydrogenase [Coxiella burnetii]OYK96700.1 acetoin dehydrogenase [Coxiella burnetii]
MTSEASIRMQDWNQYKELLYKLLRIRMIEEEIVLQYPKGKMRCPTHLSIGQEAIPIMVCENLHNTDLMVSTHRAHAHYLAKGGNLKALIAELHGKVTGATAGRGGSMNLSDLSVGFVASTAIVANTVPIGVGLAFSQKLKKSNVITTIFLGDAAVEEGVVYESLNFAVLKRLPVLFVCENNLYSVNTPLHLRQPANRAIHEMAKGIGAKTQNIDGNDIPTSFHSVCEVMKDLRANGGVWFLEFQTYRFKVHCGPEEETFTDRSKTEFDHWLARDPLSLLQSQLLTAKTVSPEEIDKWRHEIQNEIDEAFTFAESSPYPPPEDRFRYRYADSRNEWLRHQLDKQKDEVLT